MKNFVYLVLAAFPLLASAQNIPAVDVFGGYSYLSFNQPSTAVTTSTHLALNGAAFSGSVLVFHRLAAEVDISGHRLNNCAGYTVTCSNLSYMFGPRFNFGNHSNRITGFVHALGGRDRMDLPESGQSITDNSLALAAGGGFDYWVFRRIGIQFGPADYFYTRHLYNNYNAAAQNNFRVAGGIAFRFGGDFNPPEPKPPKEPKAKSEKKSEGHRSWIRPWHKSRPAPAEGQAPQPQPAESQPPAVAPAKPQPRSAPVTPTRTMPIHSLGVTVAPQEFDGAKVTEIEPGSVAEMASLKPGDLIKAVDGKPVRTPMELAAELSDKVGKVRISIQRGDWSTDTEILLNTH
jgi:hypothetical protein